MSIRVRTARQLFQQLKMPLRAKITNPAMMASTSAEVAETPDVPVIRELPGDPQNDVLFGNKYGLRTIQLNRPQKLNSLDGSMIRKILPRMLEWEKSQLANVVVMKGEGRALCAGGDVAALAKQNNTKQGQKMSTDYFELEYQLDHTIATYTKPYVAFMDGITMGGGVGLSVHAPFRIATEKTVFAMPETTIGFFPDVGAGFFLPRLDGKLGLYLALTSEQLKGVNVFYSGVATHYLHSSSLPDLEARLAEIRFQDSDSLDTRLRQVNATIEEFSTGLPHDQAISAPVAGRVRESIDYVFQDLHNYNDIISALLALAEAKDQEVKEWAIKTKKTIEQRSPTSIRVTMKQVAEGKKWSILETFRKEFTLASQFMQHPDFVEGVSALLIHKPKTTPNWKPTRVSDVSDLTVQEFFTPGNRGFRPIREPEESDYTQYPHAWTGLPTENDVARRVNGKTSRDAIIKHFSNRHNHKQGVKEKVGEILDRKTVSQRGGLSWRDS